ncbi:MAG: TonB-dependent receptor [Flavobacteriales bacterium]|nr:TonB-dependent receptor [Flavobacteriales bacterium]
MKKLLLSLVLLSINTHFFCQTITVRDALTLQPLEFVNISSPDLQKGIVTNVFGETEVVTLFGAQDIVISLLGYYDMSTSWRGLAQMNFEIHLVPKTDGMTGVVVYGNKFEEKAEDLAQRIEVLDSRKLEFLSQPTTADVLANSTGIMVQKSQLGGGSPIIRGFEANKVLMVIDGVRLNNAIYRGGHLQNVVTMDNAVMERIEIVYGPGSVVYGSDALGGVMHFYTKRPHLAPSGKEFYNTVNTFVRYSSAAQEQTGHADFNLGGKKWASFTSITYSDFDDLRMGNLRNPFYGNWGRRDWYVERIVGKDSMLVNPNPNIQVQTGYKQYDVMEKILFAQNDNVNHIFNLQFSTSSDVPRYDRLTQTIGGLPRFAEWYYGPQQRLMAAYNLELESDSAFYDHAKVTLAYQNIEESRHDRWLNKTALNHRTELLDIYTLNADFENRVKKHELRFGIEAGLNEVNSTAFVEDIETLQQDVLDTRYPDGGSTMQNMAAYFTHTIEAGERWIFSEGIRVSNVSLEANFRDTTFFAFPFENVSQNNSAVNGNLGIVMKPDTGWRVSLLASTGFRAPNVDDLAKIFESVPGNVIVPNPTLKPEYTYNLDLGVTKNFDDQASASVTGFYTIYDNAITTAPGTFNGSNTIIFSGDTSNVITSVNAEEAYLYGLNSSFEADVTSQFSVNTSLSYTVGKIMTDTTDYPLDHIPPPFGKTGFRYKRPQFQGEVYAQYSGWKRLSDYNLIGEDNFANATSEGMPSWITLNLRVAWQLNRYLQVQGALENALDQHYRVFASNISAPGRNLSLTFRARV